MANEFTPNFSILSFVDNKPLTAIFKIRRIKAILKTKNTIAYGQNIMWTDQ